MKRYVLTGGPGTGKSCILQALEARGEHTIKEAAEDHIKLRQAQGQPEPWTEADFQDKILELQVQREERVHPEAERVWIDRGVADGLGYAEPGTETYERILEEAKKRHYDKIFLVESLDHTKKTKIRREDREEAQKLGDKMKEVYLSLGYELITIPDGPLEERIGRVLEETE
jgi:predicted ATPase